MKIQTRVGFVLIVLICLANVSFTLAQTGNAGQPGEFLRFGVDTRSMAMGRAYTAMAEGASAIYWNPAGLASNPEKMQGLNFLIMLNNLYGYSCFNYFALGVPINEFMQNESGNSFQAEIRKWSVGIGFLNFSMGEFEKRDNDNRLGQKFSDNQFAFFFSLARGVHFAGQTIEVGLTYKMITHKLLSANANAGSIDLGLRFRPSFELVRLGFKLQDINQPNLAFQDGGNDIIPMTGKIGLVLDPSKLYRYLKNIKIAFDYDLIAPEKERNVLYLGAELSLQEYVTWLPIRLRLGTNSSREIFSFGASLDLPQNTIAPSVSPYLPTLDWACTFNKNEVLNNSPVQFGLNMNYSRFISAKLYNSGMKSLRAFELKTQEQLCGPPEAQLETSNQDYAKMESKFRAAINARNPGNKSYPSAAKLRLGDIQIRKAANMEKGLIAARAIYENVESLSNYSAEVDTIRNQISKIYFIQGDILGKNLERAKKNAQMLFDKRESAEVKSFSLLLLAYIDELEGKIDSALVKLQADKNPLMLYYQAKLLLNKDRAEDAANVLSEFNKQRNYAIPDTLYLPFSTKDHTLIDDSILLSSKIADASNNPKEANRLRFNLMKYYPSYDATQDLLNNNLSKTNEETGREK